MTPTFTWERKQGVLIARICGRIDSVAAYDFELSTNKNVSDDEKRLIFDMQDVTFISSSGLRVCLLTAKRFNHPGMAFGLCSLPQLVSEVMGISGFDQIIPIYPTEASAFGAFLGQSAGAVQEPPQDEVAGELSTGTSPATELPPDVTDVRTAGTGAPATATEEPRNELMHQLEINLRINFGTMRDSIGDITAYSIEKYEYSEGVTLSPAAKTKASDEVHAALWLIAERLKKHRLQAISDMFEAAEATLKGHR